MNIHSLILKTIFPFLLALSAIPINNVTASAQDWLISNYTSGGDFFGRAVAISGSTVLIGSYGSNAGGSASVFVFDGSGWMEQARFRSDVANDSFGYSVALDGDTALVGAYSSNAESGMAYIYVRSPSGYWKEQTRFNGQPGERFGYDVALSGNTAVIGTDVSGDRNGTVYVFTRSGTAWQEEAKITAEGCTGNPISLSEDSLLIGAYRRDQYAGAAYIFERTNGRWQQQAELKASDPVQGDWFGAEVCLAKSQAIIGVARKANGTGAAYVFTRSGAEWKQETKLTAPIPAENDFFGASTAIEEDMAIIGAYHRLGNRGEAYVFRREMSGWDTGKPVSPGSLNPSDWFGYAVALNNTSAIIGAPTRQDQGMVYLALADKVAPVSELLLAASETTEVDIRSAVMNAAINKLGPDGLASVYFEYGAVSTLVNITTRYTNRSKAFPISATGAFSLQITGLVPNTTYHFRAVSESSDGISFGPDMVFKTVALPSPSTTIMVAPPVITEPPSPIYLWLAAYFKIYAPIFVVLVILGIIVTKHREDKQRVIRAKKAFAVRKKNNANYDEALKKIAALLEQRKAGLIDEEQYLIQKSEIIKAAHSPDSPN